MTQRIDGTVAFHGERLAWSSRGTGPTTVVLLHGLLLDRRMHDRLATALATAGHRVLTIDLLGHGGSSRPAATEMCSTASYADQVIAVLDHLHVARAVIGGTSLGANVSLEVACRHPERVAGLVIEMPVLDNALVAAAATFTPLLALLSVAARPLRLLTSPTRRVPRRGLPGVVAMAFDVATQPPDGAAGVLRGLLFGRTAPTHGDRIRITAPTLVIGHARDPIHPFSDADMLAREVPGARLLRATSILELRLRPARLTTAIADFVDGCASAARRGPGTPTRSRRSETTPHARRPSTRTRARRAA